VEETISRRLCSNHSNNKKLTHNNKTQERVLPSGQDPHLVEKFIGDFLDILCMNYEKKFYVMLASTLIFLIVIAVVEAQEFIVLANDKGVQKSSFNRGEGIAVVITLPYTANVEVWLHNPFGSPGPSPTLFIPATPVTANIQTELGPRWLDERAPCGKYRLEIKILNPPPPLSPKTEYRYFDYAMNEPPCTVQPPPPPPPPPWDLIAAIIGSIAAVAIVLVILLIFRKPTPPPKPPTPPPPISPPPSPPPKPSKGPAPIVKGVKKEEEEI